MKKELAKKLGAEAILTAMTVPLLLAFIYWFISFVLTSYNVSAQVTDQKEDIAEIKRDVKEVRNFLLIKGK